MKLVTFEQAGRRGLGAVKDGVVVDLARIAADQGTTLPGDMLAFLALGDGGLVAAREVLAQVPLDARFNLPEASVKLLAPVPRPPSMRDAYAFRQHVETARRNRGLEMIPEFDKFPVFYFTNHNAVFGPGQVPVMARQLERLDFELECAAVIGRGGRNITAADADDHIAGFTIMNDLSARALQTEEMKLNLGPAKGKDFATALGPYLVTRDELAQKRIPGEQGERYDLEMTARVNGVQVSRDSLKNMTWTFAQIIERASYGVDLYPGDIIGSGTCGTGCFLELNGSGVTDNQWLQSGDTIDISIAGLGVLSTEIIAA